MPGLLEWLDQGNDAPQYSGGVLGGILAPSSALPALPPGDPTAQATPAAPTPSSGGNFWSSQNPDGTSDVLGGLVHYDPAKDIGANGGDRLGLIGAALKDAGAHLAGRPEAATNLQTFVKQNRALAGQQLLAQVLGGVGAPASQQPNAPGSQNMTVSTPSMFGGAPISYTSALPTLPGQTPPPPAQPPQQPMNLRSLAPRLAQIAAAGGDVSNVLTVLKAAQEGQPKFSEKVDWTKDGKPYTMADDGSIKWLDPSLTPRDKVEVANNGQAYDPYTTAPGTAFNDPNKPFGLDANGLTTPNLPAQKFEMNKVVVPAQIRTAPEWANVAINKQKANTDNLQPPVMIGFTGPDGEEKQVAAMFDRKSGKYTDASSGQVLTSTPNLRVIGNATGSARSQAAVSRVLTNAEDATSGIENLSNLSSSANGGLFKNLQTTPLSALSRTVTPQDVQDMQATTAGLGRAMGGLATGGLAVDENTQKSYEGLNINAGDTYLTKMRKMAEMRQQSTNALDVQSVSPMLSKDQRSKAAALSARIKAAIPYTVQDVQALENSQNPNVSMRDLSAQKLAAAPRPSLPSGASLPRLAPPAPAGTSRGVKWKIIGGGQ